jgi:uncharacterized phage protein (TIGR02218 family)
MRILPAGLQTHLDSASTTLCHCWRLTLATGEKLGFTDHDYGVVFDGSTFEAQSGFTASDIESSLGLRVDNLDSTGALESSRLDEVRLKSGDFDNAAVEIWRVNWSSPGQRVLLRKGHLGEVTYGSGRFTAEVRGLAQLFQQTKGRLYTFGCDAALGDGRCKIDLEQPSLKTTTTITAVNGARINVSGLAPYADDWFTHGTITWVSGVNATRKFRVKRHRRSGAIDLWQELPMTPMIGDQVELRAGCDKQPTTCTAKFANIINYRGFPHMPGNDFVASVASATDGNNDGGKRG